MASFRFLLVLVNLGAAFLPFAAAGAGLGAFQSPAKQVTLLELFTSEGCSSCPPADKWLGNLKSSPRLWVDFVPVAFHVDYWDHLGWRDPWSARAHTVRQQNYAETWRSRTVYTPGFVLNGREWRGWSRYSAGPPSTNISAGILQVASLDFKTWKFNFAPVVGKGREYQGHVALLASGLTSHVAAGENRGRRLEHDFVVIALVQGSLKVQGAGFQGQLTLPDRPAEKNTRLAIAAWVTEADRPVPVQATGGWLQSMGKDRMAGEPAPSGSNQTLSRKVQP